MPIPWEKVSIAPMMDITDRRFRYFMRLINARTKLYTEMIVAQAIVHAGQKGESRDAQQVAKRNRDRLLRFDAREHPVVLQLGGDDIQLLAEAAQIGADYGYDAIDLNCGCPSERVENGNFGVSLMRSPERVAEIVSAMRNRSQKPISVKCRIGITGEESEEKLHCFAESVFSAGAQALTVHARTATLNHDGKSLSPKQNREIPPLDYALVYRLKNRFSKHTIEINGGIKTTEMIHSHLENVDRVMIGRLAHDDPYFFSDGRLTRMEILHAMAEYATEYESADLNAARFFANMTNLFHALPGARHARRFLSEAGRHLSPRAAVDELAGHALTRLRNIEALKQGNLL